LRKGFRTFEKDRAQKMRRKLGINIDFMKDGFTFGAIKKIKEAGFDSISVTGVNWGFNKYKDISDSLGLDWEFVHAPFTNINSMWLEGDDYLRIFGNMKEAITHASLNGVPIVVLHLSSGWNPPEVNELGIKRFDELVKHAAQKNVTVAFENLRNVENLEAIMEHYANTPNVKYCYDCGHEHCYTKDVDWIEKFGNKLCCVHIHDNFGIQEPEQECTDLHYLPFDGEIDFKDMIDRLDKVGFEGTLMLEVFNHCKPEYMELTEEEFLKTSFERISRISEL